MIQLFNVSNHNIDTSKFSNLLHDNIVSEFEEKIAKYPKHYYNRFEDGKLVESWMMKGMDVYNILLPKLKNKYLTVLEKKDPRLSASISWTEIKKFGTKVI